jgi:hypothetical protein
VGIDASQQTLDIAARRCGENNHLLRRAPARPAVAGPDARAPVVARRRVAAMSSSGSRAQHRQAAVDLR